MRIITWGTGKIAEKVFSNNIKFGVEIVAVVDNNVKRQGTMFHGISVISPNDLGAFEFDIILVLTIRGSYEINNQLKEMGIDEGRIENVKSIIDLDYYSCVADKYFDIKKQEFKKWERNKPVDFVKRQRETSKSHNRRDKENFFEKYCRGEGLDIGWGGDLLSNNCYVWDIENGDAQYLEGIDDNSFDFVYSSHCLEHMKDVRIALRNWFRVCKPNGYLIIAVPHRDLYEKKDCLPSRFNSDHKHMFLIGVDEPPDTLDIINEIKNSLKGYDIQYVKKCDEGHTIDDPLLHSDGEYQIEVVIRKL